MFECGRFGNGSRPYVNNVYIKAYDCSRVNGMYKYGGHGNFLGCRYTWGRGKGSGIDQKCGGLRIIHGRRSNDAVPILCRHVYLRA